MTDASRIEIRITGFGGQGVVLSGHIIGRACAVHADKHATMIQSFGPEARGSACSTTRGGLATPKSSTPTSAGPMSLSSCLPRAMTSTATSSRTTAS